VSTSRAETAVDQALTRSNLQIVTEGGNALEPTLASAVPQLDEHIGRANSVAQNNASAAPGPADFMGNSDNFYRFASRRSDIDPNGHFDVIAHGTSSEIEILTSKGSVMVDQRVAAKLIQQSPGYRGQPIRLLSCETGACDAGFAQNLANKMNVPVQAPTELCGLRERKDACGSALVHQSQNARIQLARPVEDRKVSNLYAKKGGGMSRPMDAHCEKCGGEIEVRTEGSTQGIYCTRCDWAVVTTNILEIVKDRTAYEVSLLSGNFQDKDQVRVIAEVSGVNFLEAREILKSENVVIFSGRATEVLNMRSRLAAVGISFAIRPEFHY
jgi:hypothetical protein